MEDRVKKTMESLLKNKIATSYFENSSEAVNYLLNEIENSSTVGIGGSMTVMSLEIPQKLIARGNHVAFHWLENSAEKMDEARGKASKSDVYLTSTNALTEKGQLVNIDGVGNRVASMIYGPKKVYIICGVNKITSDFDSAVERIKSNAYKNARRLKLNTPCAANEKCIDCCSPERMCNVMTVIDKKPSKIQMEVIIINDELGY